MTDIATEAKLAGARNPGIAQNALPWSTAIRSIARADIYDIATVALIVSLVAVVCLTFRDYAISNDEGVQQHYGELIIAYYTSGFRDQSVFSFQNLYLYGGLFDIVAVALGHLIPIDPFDLRHILCALTGIAGIGAAAAAARLIAGPRAALIAAVALSVCGAWYGAIFNHTKDIPFAAAMVGATLFLIRIARMLPAPRASDITAFGLLAGAALGIRVLGLLLVVYAALAIILYMPRGSFGQGNARWRFVIESASRFLPALMLAYVIMIFAWPWAALAPLNPMRGLLEFSEFHYSIRTMLAGQIYEMANVPAFYVPTYILIRMPLLMLAGVVFALIFALVPVLAQASKQVQRRDIAFLSLTVMFPLACQMIFHGPAFTGLRHFLFVIPVLAILAGVGLDAALSALAVHGRKFITGGLAIVTVCFLGDAVMLARLHPYEYLYYNSLVGGLSGASRRYDVDYWFDSMPEAIHKLEAYLRHTSAVTDPNWQSEVYSVAVCGERLSFDKNVTLPQLKWDFKPTWSQSEFFIAPTQMNCDEDLDGKIVGTVERLGVTIAYIKDRRALVHPTAMAAH